MRPSKLVLIEEVCKLVQGATGIQLGERQFSMVESRLHRRMSELGISDPEQYRLRLISDPAAETAPLISLLATHHTYFFREPLQFEQLETSVLAEVVEAARKEGRSSLRVWSAACSYGHEVYSLAMFLDRHLKRLAPEMSFSILGSDVDHEAVEVARNGVYHVDEVKEIPSAYLSNHWTRGREGISDYFRVGDELRRRCRFETRNLFAVTAGGAGERFDLIFCRNVFIYFNAQQTAEIATALSQRLEAGGFLFLGLSESLHGLGVALHSRGNSIYSRAPIGPAPAARKEPASKARGRELLKVMCVDDSPSVLRLLKEILSREQGFEVVGTAADGAEAAEKLKQCGADLVTLDIHMPQVGGLEYLRRFYRPGHPPVVIISSVPYESAELALDCLKAGAADYVEKPALWSLSERGDEIRAKLRCAAAERGRSGAQPAAPRILQFKKSVPRPAESLRWIIARAGDRSKLRWLMESWSGLQPPTILMLEGAESILPALSTEFAGAPWEQIREFEPGTALQPNVLYLADFAKRIEEIESARQGRRLSVLVLGEVSERAALRLSRVPRAQLLLEERSPDSWDRREILKQAATQIVPYTSLGFLSCEYLERSDGD